MLGARTPTHGNLIGLTSASLWNQCNLSPFLKALQTVGDHTHYIERTSDLGESVNWLDRLIPTRLVYNKTMH